MPLPPQTSWGMRYHDNGTGWNCGDGDPQECFLDEEHFFTVGGGRVDWKQNQTASFDRGQSNDKIIAENGILASSNPSIREKSNPSATTYFEGLFLSNFSIPDADGIVYDVVRSYNDPGGRGQKHTAICEMNAAGWHNFIYHPHFLQLFLRCWSFFEGESKNNATKIHAKRRIISIPDKYGQFIDGTVKNRFIRELKLVLKLSGVEVMKKSAAQRLELLERSSNNCVSAATVVQFNKRSFWMASPEHAQDLRRRLMNACGISVNQQQQDSTTNTTAQHATYSSQQQSSSCTPRVAILNRQNERKLLHADDIAKAIPLELVGTTRRRDSSSPVEVSYFETASLCDQVKFFSTTDVVISPHGAQLSALFAMPPNIGGTVLEIFPLGFVIPWYFGSLAASSGIDHTFLYETQGDLESELAYGLATSKRQAEAKARDLSVSTDIVVKSVREIVDRWKEANGCKEGPLQDGSIFDANASQRSASSTATSTSSNTTVISSLTMLPSTDWMQ
eukprot:CAMPEP_0117010880 /NCGR_PEP_ID=MMETSP0472-20121206/9478_1 /TAXON_ID=693140 ORGANISM="Tiarina fusus, Strain LIS" /NCGR_SAMPLE_ID=MMETSP0472 /ASSEMBLY_ACC=CAM_ASM_000603 /LENGTH=504 /DNA_ID=CAMNT_0004713527 /DNA_START=127 /DNA_END=1642 /DNA_ORIENTATION=+